MGWEVEGMFVPEDRVIYRFSPRMEPVAEVGVGEEVVFRTQDALGGQIRGEGDSMEIDFSRVNPATGPVWVKGAKPGMALVVEVLEVFVPEGQGVVVASRGLGVLPDLVEGFRAKVLPVKGGEVHFGDVAVPLRPMVGVMGVAPAEGEYPTGVAHRHGGNMDAKEIGVGARVWFPVFQEGALLAMGDLHAAMGDGEVCVSACEVPGEVRVRLRLEEKPLCLWPVVERPEAFHLLVSLPTVEEALREATREAVSLLSSGLGIAPQEAYMLASLCVDVGITQLVDPHITARAVIPRHVLGL